MILIVNPKGVSTGFSVVNSLWFLIAVIVSQCFYRVCLNSCGVSSKKQAGVQRLGSKGWGQVPNCELSVFLVYDKTFTARISKCFVPHYLSG